MMPLFGMRVGDWKVGFERWPGAWSELTRRVYLDPDCEGPFNVIVRWKSCNKRQLSFSERFRNRWEPDFMPTGLYREVYGMARLTYQSECGLLLVELPDERTVDFEVIIDAILQLLWFAAAETGLVPFHTAGVSFDQHSVLLLGGSGSGKSTLCLMLTEMGLDFVCDDVVLLDSVRMVCGAGEYRISCRRRTAEMMNDLFPDRDWQRVLQEYPESDASRTMAQSKVLVDPCDISGTRWEKMSFPTLLVFPTLCESMSCDYLMEQLSSREALRRLCQLSIASPFQSSLKKAYFKSITGLVKRCRAVSLATNPDAGVQGLQAAAASLMTTIIECSGENSTALVNA